MSQNAPASRGHRYRGDDEPGGTSSTCFLLRRRGHRICRAPAGLCPGRGALGTRGCARRKSARPRRRNREAHRHTLADGRRRRRGRTRPAMLRALRRAMPAVRALPGRAEEISLPEGRIDAVLAGNAMHWFDMAVAAPEIARVLSAGGVLAGLWNVVDDRVDWVARLAQVSGSAAIGPRDTRTSWRAATVGALVSTSAASWFEPPEHAEFAHGQRRTADSLVATLATRAGMLVMPDHERIATLGRIAEFLASRPETADGELTLPMLTCVQRLRRR
ncbi:MAG: class I SAM-dependent methyltransferase [Phycicoccus sp.]